MIIEIDWMQRVPIVITLCCTYPAMNVLMNKITGNAKKNALPNAVNFTMKDFTFSLAVFIVFLIPKRKYKNIPSLIATSIHPTAPPY